MGTEEGGVGSGDGATGAAQLLRRNDPGPLTAMDRRAMAGYLQLFKRGFRVVQPDGGLPRGMILAPDRPQGWILYGRLLEQLAATASGIPGPDCPSG